MALLGTKGYSDIPDYDWTPQWNMESYFPQSMGKWGQGSGPVLSGYEGGGNLGYDISGYPEMSYDNMYGGGLGPSSSLFQGGFQGGNPMYQPAEGSLSPTDYGVPFRSMYQGGSDIEGSLANLLGALHTPHTPSYQQTPLETDPVGSYAAPPSQYTPPSYLQGADYQAGMQPSLLENVIPGGDQGTSPWSQYFNPYDIVGRGAGEIGVGGEAMGQEIQAQMGGIASPESSERAQVAISGAELLPAGSPLPSQEDPADMLGSFMYSDPDIPGQGSGMITGLKPEFYKSLQKIAKEAQDVSAYTPYGPDEQYLERDIALGHSGTPSLGRTSAPQGREGYFGELNDPGERLSPRRQYEDYLNEEYREAVEGGIGDVQDLLGNEAQRKERVQESEANKFYDFMMGSGGYNELLGDEGGGGQYGKRRNLWEDYVEKYNELSEQEVEGRGELDEEISDVAQASEVRGQELSDQIAAIDLKSQQVGVGETPARRRIRGFEGGGLRSGRRRRVGREEEGKIGTQRAEIALERQEAIDSARRDQAKFDYEKSKARREKVSLSKELRQDADQAEAAREEEILMGETSVEEAGDPLAIETGLGLEGAGIQATRDLMAGESPQYGMGTLLGGLRGQLEEQTQPITALQPKYAVGGQYQQDLEAEVLGGRGVKKALGERREDYTDVQEEGLSSDDFNLTRRLAPDWIGQNNPYSLDLLGNNFQSSSAGSAMDFVKSNPKSFRMFGQKYWPGVTYKTSAGAAMDWHWQNRARSAGWGPEDLGFKRSEPDRTRSIPDFWNWKRWRKYPQLITGETNPKTFYPGGTFTKDDMKFFGKV